MPSDGAFLEIICGRGLVAKVAATQAAGWGGSTNFAAACEMILATAEKAKLKPDEVPDLIVFSDMQFDQAGGSRTNFEAARSLYAARGKQPWRLVSHGSISRFPVRSSDSPRAWKRSPPRAAQRWSSRRATTPPRRDHYSLLSVAEAWRRRW